ncbi:AraC family transcriptional regulator [Azospirillum sp. YIM B02556]|uniref:AraC family transcriptional regulator n=1 Tax=Azospirillum endophyticum TaxID=2800326 RepID=A0ABS1F0I7_9PROT|nr:AraC family transcriptional regulator [Azospirillum endophyticum]MBK1836933.1 AraC family transcriptional regulator [Azospirillum endophyticum]
MTNDSISADATAAWPVPCSAVAAKAGTRLDYGDRIDRVVVYIAAHLDEPLDLDRLAEVACFSPYHFHRVYRAITGETAAETLRRLRLHRAAGDLVRDGIAIPAIARRAGYGSVEAFTRAFGQGYGATPAAYRKRGRLNPPVPANHRLEDRMYDVEIRDLPAHRIVGLPHTGPYMTIGVSFDRLYAWAYKQGLVGPGTRSFAIYYDDPESVKPEELRSFAGLMLNPGVVEDGLIHGVDIPGGPHAVVRHKGPYAELGAVYRWLYGEWLPNSGHAPGDAPCYEEYLNNPRALPPAEWLTEICIPLAG